MEGTGGRGGEASRQSVGYIFLVETGHKKLNTRRVAVGRISIAEIAMEGIIVKNITYYGILATK